MNNKYVSRGNDETVHKINARADGRARRTQDGTHDGMVSKAIQRTTGQTNGADIPR